MTNHLVSVHWCRQCRRCLASASYRSLPRDSTSTFSPTNATLSPSTVLLSPPTASRLRAGATVCAPRPNCAIYPKIQGVAAVLTAATSTTGRAVGVSSLPNAGVTGTPTDARVVWARLMSPRYHEKNFLYGVQMRGPMCVRNIYRTRSVLETVKARKPKLCLFVLLVGFLTSSSTTRLYRGRAPRQSV